MAENKEPQSLLKKVDLGDMRILVVGIILLIIPILFLMYNLTRSGTKDVVSSTRDRLGMSKAAFSFQRTASQHPASKTGTAAKAP
ncbi:MAG: hypothetical protein ACD_39C01168G0001, partial [uncultured bacterium]